MKRILITGAGSFIGEAFEQWCTRSYTDKYYIESLDMKNEKWKERSFYGFDSILHVAGIVHVSIKPSQKGIYYKVNRDLAVETALKAKNEGVKQFVFISSISVYGDECSINKKRVINGETNPAPTNDYGKSKLEAENILLTFQDKDFNLAIVRSPMVYGEYAKGNYAKLSRLARIMPIFPYIENERSMIFVNNLCEFIRLLIENDETGIFFPQNKEYVNTSEMVRLIAEAHGKQIKLTTIFNPLLKLLSKNIKSLNKVFGNLVCDKSISQYKENYCVSNLSESIKIAETNKAKTLK